MPRKQHKYHYIYKVICKISEKYYIGMHSTSNLEDEYFGSGKVLKRSLNKYGKENHTFEILEYLPDRSSLKLREKELVNEGLLKDPKCMNLQLGGGGGFSSTEHKMKFHISGGKSIRKKCKTDPKYYEELCERLSKVRKPFINKKGRKLSEEAKKKIGESNSISQKGNKNSQFGTMWITNGKESIKIKKDQAIPNGWIKGRKMAS